jgi:hypothetical protein
MWVEVVSRFEGGWVVLLWQGLGLTSVGLMLGGSCG